MVGHHGETILQLLRPGFHSGTVPRLFNHLRHAERQAMATGTWRTARSYRHELQQVEKAVRLFVEREFLVLLSLSKSWKDQPLKAGSIELATRTIRLDLEHGDHASSPVRVTFSEQAGWLMVQIEQVGWLPQVTASQFDAFTGALAGMYKMAGVAIVREQVQAGLASTGCEYAIQQEGLELRCPPELSESLLCSIHDTVRLRFLGTHVEIVDNLPALPPLESLIFARVPLRWNDWVAGWLREQQGQPLEMLPRDLVLAPGQVAQAPAVPERPAVASPALLADAGT
jgi:hypothetical protein